MYGFRWRVVAVGVLFLACGSDGDSPPAENDAGAPDAQVPEDSGLPAPIDADRESSVAPSFNAAPQLRLGFQNACTLATDGALKCWGGGRPSPLPVAEGVRFRAVSPGASTEVCAIREDGALVCWKNETFVPEVKDARSFTSLSVGASYGCAITTTGQMFCWGENAFGQLGTGDTTTAQVLSSVAGNATDWQSVTAGHSHTCAIRKSGALYCWGRNSQNQLGDGAGGTADGGSTRRLAPVEIAPGTTWKDVAMGSATTCGIRSDGALLCWGVHLTTGQLNSPTPKEVDGARDWARIRMERSHACALKTNGAVYCWGDNSYGQLGDGTLASRSEPVRVGTDADWTDVDVGYGTACGRKADGSIRCWGWNARGNLGNGTSLHATPKQVAPGEQFKQVALNFGGRTCALKKSGHLFCWGTTILNSNQRNQEPEAVGSDTWASIALGAEHACARQMSGAISCWGSNSEGESGLPSGGNRIAVPTPIGFSADSLVAGFHHTCALAAGKLHCWGFNDMRQANPSSTRSIKAPTKVSDDDWLEITAGQINTCGLRPNHEVWCFGGGFTTPMQRADGTTAWTKAAGAGADLHFYLKSGALHVIGSIPLVHAYQQGTGYVSASSRSAHHCGIRADGTLWCGGGNKYGQLGDGSIELRESPVQIGTSSDWTMVDTSLDHTCGLRNGGDLYCWGSNDAGQIGDGSAWSTTPVVVQ